MDKDHARAQKRKMDNKKDDGKKSNNAKKFKF